MTARDLQDVWLAQHAETYLEQEQRKDAESGSGGRTEAQRRHERSYRNRIEEAKNKHVD